MTFEKIAACGFDPSLYMEALSLVDVGSPVDQTCGNSPSEQAAEVAASAEALNLKTAQLLTLGNILSSGQTAATAEAENALRVYVSTLNAQQQCANGDDKLDDGPPCQSQTQASRTAASVLDEAVDRRDISTASVLLGLYLRSLDALEKCQQGEPHPASARAGDASPP